MEERQKLTIKMDSESTSGHPALVSSATGDTRFCAHSHCQGQCGLPALFVRVGDMEYKAHGEMVACGPVWQQKSWQGTRVYLPDDYCTSSLLEMWWW